MKDISVNYPVGKETQQLEIEFLAHGAGQIMMDKYFHGQVVLAPSQWRVFLADNSGLNNSDDIQAIIQILSEQKEC